MTTDTINVGIIGAGGIAAKLHLPELQTVEGCRVVTLSGRTQHRLDLLCERFGVSRSENDYETVIHDPNIDAVVIALPHPLHVKYGLMAIAAGKHVHMQKPLSTSLDEAEEFVQAVEASDRIVFALPFVSSPKVLAAREFVQKGTLGKVSSAHARFSHGGPEVYYATIQELLQEESSADDELWFFDAQRADVGALFDMGVYAIAHLVAVLGSVTAVTCRCTTFNKPTTLEDTASLILEFENGALGTAETGWCDGARTYGFSIHGTQGKLTNPPLTDDLVHAKPTSLTDEDAPLTEEFVDLNSYPNVNSHQHWTDCIRANEQPPISNVHFARHITEIMLQGLKSSQQGKTVPIVSRLKT